MTGSSLFIAGKSKKKQNTFVTSPEDYGAIGDGVADDTDAFMAMNAAILAEQAARPGVKVTINFEPGADYVYTNNKWSWNIEYLTLNGNGATIKNVSGAMWPESIQWWTNGGPSGIWSDTDPVDMGYKIDTAIKGSTSVTLKDASKASEYNVGDWALVASYTQQDGGWPPNARLFDYAKIVSKDGGTITLDRPLDHTHRDNFPTRDHGRDDEIDVAMLIKAERNANFAEDWLVRDLTVLPNPNWFDGSHVNIDGFNKLVFENVNFTNYDTSQGISLTFRNSILPKAEPDKMLETLTIENCQADFMVFASGVETLNLINSTTEHFYFAGRHLNIEGSTITQHGPENEWDPLHLGGQWSVESVSIKDTVINGPGLGVEGFLKTGWTDRFVIGEGFILDGEDLIVNDPESYFSGIGMHNRMYEGQKLTLENGSEDALGYGTVVEITDNGAPATARLKVDWTITPENGMVVAQDNIAKVIGENVTLNNTFLEPSWNDPISHLVWNGEVLEESLWPMT